MLTLQVATRVKTLPSKQQFQQWVDAVLTHEKIAGELSVRLVGRAESQRLNHLYRQQDKPTNILSFPPAVAIGRLAPPMLGDLVICAPLITTQAKQQGKKPLDHWAHLVIHGTLHLLGYTHEQAATALEMEQLETNLLANFGVSNPYEDPSDALV